MMNKATHATWMAGWAIWMLCCTGCQTTLINMPAAGDLPPVMIEDSPMPRELYKVSLPQYRIEPPDILQINAVRLMPKLPYRVEPMDSLLIQVPGAFPTEPISGIYPVEADGTINLGLSYGTARLAGLTLEEAKTALEAQLKPILKDNKVLVSVAQSRGLQQIAGEHLVRPDGTIGLGAYGSVRVAGMTLDQARKAVEMHLTQFLQTPEISIDVLAYNSKVYYVIFDGGGYGQQIARMPITGNDTVLDALSQVNGLPAMSSKHHIWIARPASGKAGCQILPVDWVAITKCGATATNYQLFPGDRIYVKADFWVAFDNFIGKVTAPFERLIGFTILGNGMVRNLQQGSGDLNNNNNFGGF